MQSLRIRKDEWVTRQLPILFQRFLILNPSRTRKLLPRGFADFYRTAPNFFYHIWVVTVLQIPFSATKVSVGPRCGGSSGPRLLSTVQSSTTGQVRQQRQHGHWIRVFSWLLFQLDSCIFTSSAPTEGPAVNAGEPINSDSIFWLHFRSHSSLSELRRSSFRIS